MEEADRAKQDVQDAQEDSDAAQDEDGGLEMFVADQAQLVQAEAHLRWTGNQNKISTSVFKKRFPSFRLFSVTSSALDHSATAPPYSLDYFAFKF